MCVKSSTPINLCLITYRNEYGSLTAQTLKKIIRYLSKQKKQYKPPNFTLKIAYHRSYTVYY